MDDKPTLTVDQAADWLNVHANTVYELIEDCVLPAGKQGRGYVLLKEDVARHIVKLVREQTAARMGGKPLTRKKKKAPEPSPEPGGER